MQWLEWLNLYGIEQVPQTTTASLLVKEPTKMCTSTETVSRDVYPHFLCRGDIPIESSNFLLIKSTLLKLNFVLVPV